MTVYLGDLTEEESFAKLCTDLKNALEKEENEVRVALLCGDGSIMKTLQKMNELHNVDISKISVAVLPFGTGND